MFFTNINLLTVFIASAVAMGVGFIWYSPFVFGKAWMRASGVVPGPEADAQRKGMAKTFFFSFLLMSATSYILAVTINSMFIRDMYAAIIVGLALSIGFIVSAKVNDRLFTKTPWPIVLISSGYYVLSIVVMTIVLALFS